LRSLIRPATGRSGAAPGQGVADVAVVIPPAHRHLNEPHARLAQSAGEQARPLRSVSADAIQIPGHLRLAREVDQPGRLGLHPEGQLEGFDHALHAAVGFHPVEQAAVHPLEHVEPLSLYGWARLVINQVLDRGSAASRNVHRRPLVRSGQEPCAIGPHVAIGMDRDEARQVLGLGRSPGRS
jgi:hypothetical protein